MTRKEAMRHTKRHVQRSYSSRGGRQTHIISRSDTTGRSRVFTFAERLVRSLRRSAAKIFTRIVRVGDSQAERGRKRVMTKSERRKQAKAEGKCRECFKEPVAKGCFTCAQCVDKKKASRLATGRFGVSSKRLAELLSIHENWVEVPPAHVLKVIPFECRTEPTVRFALEILKVRNEGRRDSSVGITFYKRHRNESELDYLRRHSREWLRQQIKESDSWMTYVLWHNTSLNERLHYSGKASIRKILRSTAKQMKNVRLKLGLEEPDERP